MLVSIFYAEAIDGHRFVNLRFTDELIEENN